MKGKLLHTLIFISLTIFVYAGSDEPEAICPTIFMSGSDVNCYGNSNGSASVLAINGSGNYTYTWSNGANSTTINGLSVGTYTVNVRDNVTGCTVIGAFVVGSPDPISTSEIVTDVLCKNDATGSVYVTTIGGTSPYNFSWSNGTTGEDLTNVTAGNYTLDIIDDNGCTYSELYVIDEPLEEIQASSVASDALCFGSATGTIDLTVWGGTPAYAYTWSTGASTQDVSGLAIGNYSVEIRDLNNCTLNVPFTIGQPLALSGITSSTDVLCYGDPTGSATITVAGGTSPYNYSWQNSSNLFAENNSTLSNIPADDYQITVTDDNGCIYVDNITVVQPAPLLVSESITNVSCYGGSDGSVELNVSGGIPAYSFEWMNSVPSVVGNAQDLLNVPADFYNVTVTDLNGCTANLSAEVTQPNAPITFSFEVTDVLCFGENTGAVDLTASGGTAPFSYTWTSGQGTEDIDNMLAGTYGFTIIDANLCTESGTVTIDQPNAPLTVTSIVTDVNCFGESNGSIDLTVTGGTPGYTFDWDNSTFNLSYTQEDLINFPSDDYRIEVTDANGCQFVDTILIDEPPLLILSGSQVDVLCYGESTGSIDLTVVGGVAPYLYSWSNGFTTEDIASLPAGPYDVLVTDDHGCTETYATVITQPSDTISFTSDVFNVHCFNGSNGAIDLFVNGGTPPYSYLWNNGQTTADIQNLVADWHTFDVIDANGCLFQDSILVTQPDDFLPNETISNVTCYGLNDGVIDITPSGGTPPFAYAWYNSTFALADQSEDLVNYPADVYQLEVIDSNGCFYEFFMELTQPDSLIIDYTVKQVTCYGGDDGAIYTNITGGTPDYETIWSNGDNAPSLVGVVSDTFSLVVTDANGCMDSITAFVPQPDSMFVTFEHDPVTCIDQMNGVGYAYPVGGNGGYSYEWESSATDYIAGGLGNDFYYVIVTDMLGCQVVDSVYITKINAPCIDPPTAFTPNGDQYNDAWQIDNLYLYPNVQVLVFNKWGNVVHEQNGTYEPWDGNINGQVAPSGTYFWVINPNYLDREAARGNVTIVK